MGLYKGILVSAIFLIFGTGCMHGHKIEVTDEKPSVENGVQVTIGAEEVKVDEVINVFQRSCVKTRIHPRAEPKDDCKLTRVGKAKVAKVIDHDSAVVVPLDGLKMDSTMRVEKSRD